MCWQVRSWWAGHVFFRSCENGCERYRAGLRSCEIRCVGRYRVGGQVTMSFRSCEIACVDKYRADGQVSVSSGAVRLGVLAGTELMGRSQCLQEL